jgi:hypothetical protein
VSAIDPPELDDGADDDAAPLGRAMAVMGGSVAAAAIKAKTKPQRSFTLSIPPFWADGIG